MHINTKNTGHFALCVNICIENYINKNVVYNKSCDKYLNKETKTTKGKLNNLLNKKENELLFSISKGNSDNNERELYFSTVRNHFI